MLAVATDNGVKVYETATWSVMAYNPVGGKVFKLAWTAGAMVHPDTTYEGLYYAAENGLYFWSTSPLSPLKTFHLQNSTNWSVAVSPNIYFPEVASVASMLDSNRVTLEEFAGGYLPVLEGKPKRNVPSNASSGLFFNEVWGTWWEKPNYLISAYERPPEEYLPSNPMAMNYSPDGNDLAIATSPSPITWRGGEYGSHHLQMDLPDHFLQPVELLDLDWSPDGNYLAAGGSTLAIWDASTGNVLHQLNGHKKYVWSVAYSPDGGLLTSGSEDGTVRLWNTGLGSEVTEIEAHSSGVRGVAWAPVGMNLASAGRDKTLKIWELMDYPDWNVLAPAEIVPAIDLSDVKITGENLERITKLAAIPSQDTFGILINAAYYSPPAISPDGELLAWKEANWDPTWAMRVWNLRTGSIYVIEKETPVGFTPDGAYLVSVGVQGLRYYEWKDRFALKKMISGNFGDRGRLVSGMLSPSGEVLASAGSSEGAVKLWQVAAMMPEQKPLLSLDNPGAPSSVNRMQFSPNTEWLAISYYPGMLVLWRWQDGTHKQTLVWEYGGTVYFAFSPDARYLAVVVDWSWQKENPGLRTIELWELRDGEYVRVRELTTSYYPPGFLSFSSDGDILAAQLSGIEFIRVSDGTVLHVLDDQPYGHAVFSPNGTFIVTSSFDGLAIWGVAP
jgi:WD40 repeat protein